MRRGIPKMVTLHKLDDVIGNMTLRHAAMQKNYSGEAVFES